MSQRTECKLYKEGKCSKYWRPSDPEMPTCRPTTLDDFDERLDLCEMNEVCENDSIFGGSYFAITDKDIEALKAGKVLYKLDEYGIFIAYAPKEDPHA